MPKFSKTSVLKLSSCHPDLVALMNEAIKYADFSIICGYRSKQEQDLAYNKGTSKLKYPTSKHNHQPSLAVDVAPVKYKNGKSYIDWEDIKSFTELYKVIKDCADKLNIKIRWGGDFNQDGNITTNDAWDKPHYELVL